MPIFKQGDVITFPIKLKVVRMFGYRDNIYYIVEVIQNKVPWQKVTKMYGTLNVNGDAEVPKIVQQKADVHIAQIKSQNSE